MAVDGQGRPVRFILTGGQRNDITQAPALLAGFKPKCVLADKGYDSRQLVAQIHSLGAQLVIPPRSCQQPRAYDKALYRLRNRIECCFARLKQFRRIATRFDRKPSHFLAFLYLASIPLWVGGMSRRPRAKARKVLVRRNMAQKFEWRNVSAILLLGSCTSRIFDAQSAASLKEGWPSG